MRWFDSVYICLDLLSLHLFFTLFYYDRIGILHNFVDDWNIQYV